MIPVQTLNAQGLSGLLLVKGSRSASILTRAKCSYYKEMFPMLWDLILGQQNHPGDGTCHIRSNQVHTLFRRWSTRLREE